MTHSTTETMRADANPIDANQSAGVSWDTAEMTSVALLLGSLVLILLFPLLLLGIVIWVGRGPGRPD
ncbi:hypothetical protein [Thermopirellula anaerolimosa]